MSDRIVVPTPSFLPKKDTDRISNTSSAINKVTTVLTNLQRRNVQTLKVDSQVALSVFQMAAQGELLQLQAKIDTPGVNIDERDDKVNRHCLIPIGCCFFYTIIRSSGRNANSLYGRSVLYLIAFHNFLLRASRRYCGLVRTVRRQQWNCYCFGVPMHMCGA